MENSLGPKAPEAKKGKRKNYKWFVGIDVSKGELDFAVIDGSGLLFHEEISNHQDAIRQFCDLLKARINGFRFANALFCMEHTGYYCFAIRKVLLSRKANFAIENALRIKRSSGLVRGKDDRADAIMIARYAQNHSKEIRLWEPRRQVLEELQHLSTLRNRLMGVSLRLDNPLREQKVFLPRVLQKKIGGLCKETIVAANADLNLVESAIERLISGDERLSRLFQIITSVQSVGKITAVQVILATNEFRNICCPKKFACYAGVAPFKMESGIVRKKHKTSLIGSRKMKSLLHQCATNAILRHPELKAYYHRKTKIEGKAKMAVINAVRYKLILRIFACLKQDRLYEKEYIRPHEEQEGSMH